MEREMTEADRVRAWRDRRRGRPPRPYHRRRPPLEPGLLTWRDPEVRARRSAAMRAAWDDPLLRAQMRAHEEKFERLPNGRFVKKRGKKS